MTHRGSAIETARYRRQRTRRPRRPPVGLDPTPYRLARRTDDTGAEILRATRHADVLHSADGTKLALFTSEFPLALVERDHPEVTLDRMLQR